MISKSLRIEDCCYCCCLWCRVLCVEYWLFYQNTDVKSMLITDMSLMSGMSIRIKILKGLHRAMNLASSNRIKFYLEYIVSTHNYL